MKIGDKVQVINLKLKTYNKIGKVIDIDDDKIWVELEDETNSHNEYGLFSYKPTSLKILQSTDNNKNMEAPDFKVNDLVRVTNKELMTYNQLGFVKRIADDGSIRVTSRDTEKDTDITMYYRPNNLEILCHEDDLASRKMRLLYENSSYGRIGEGPDDLKEVNMEGENLIRKHFDNLRNTIYEAYNKKQLDLFNKTKVGQLIVELEAEMQTIEPTVKDIRYMFSTNTIWTKELKVKMEELEKKRDKDINDLHDREEQALTLFRMCEMYEQKVELLKRYDCID